jgi:hypothetical protein
VFQLLGRGGEGGGDFGWGAGVAHERSQLEVRVSESHFGVCVGKSGFGLLEPVFWRQRRRCDGLLVRDHRPQGPPHTCFCEAVHGRVRYEVTSQMKWCLFEER